MTTQEIVPKTKEEWLQLRVDDVTSTEVSALFGLSPYMTKYELWHRKRAKTIVTLEENERMTWGKRLEFPIAKGIAEDHKWAVRAMPEYIRDPEAHAGASYDFRILAIATKQLDAARAAGKPAEELKLDGSNSLEDGILEIKNVDGIAFKQGWAVDESGIEAPPHIELQVQQELWLSRLKYAKIGALVGGNSVKVITRERDEKIIGRIKEEIAAFWKSIAENVEPKPDFERDAEFIKSVQSFAEPDKVLTCEGDHLLDLARTYKSFGDQITAAQKAKDGIKAQLLLAIGDAEKVIGNGFKISASMIAGGHVEYDKEPYRDFRVTWPKEARK